MGLGKKLRGRLSSSSTTPWRPWPSAWPAPTRPTTTCGTSCPGAISRWQGENVLVADIRNAAEGDTHGGKELTFARGIEVGHVFKLGTKYSEKLGAKFLDEAGVRAAVHHGLLRHRHQPHLRLGHRDVGHDDNGCMLPVDHRALRGGGAAHQHATSPHVVAEAERIYDELQAAGVDVLLDDRDARPGVKFKDADLIGIPLRLVVGEKALAEGQGGAQTPHRRQARPWCPWTRRCRRPLTC